MICFGELCPIIEGTEAQVYIKKYIPWSKFCFTWRKLYDDYLGKGTKDILAGELENKTMNLKYVGPFKGFSFATYVEQHKMAYETMLALAKKMDGSYCF